MHDRDTHRRIQRATPSELVLMPPQPKKTDDNSQPVSAATFVIKSVNLWYFSGRNMHDAEWLTKVSIWEARASNLARLDRDLNNF